jgi:hypothetical protein
MAHWAKLDNDNKVIEVTVGSNADSDEGYDWLVTNLGGRWVKTSYNTVAGVHTNGGTPFRGNFAGVGYTYDEGLDAFIAPKPYPSWVLDEATFSWEAPVAKPEGNGLYWWDESAGAWVEVEDEAV